MQMYKPEFENVTVAEMKQYISRKNEHDYLLVDVRQPDEYRAGHIPGAMLVPLPELESKVFDLPDDKEILIYCRSGGRSTAAASFVSEAEITEKTIYNLTGGILAWEGNVLPGVPRAHVFENCNSSEELMYTAMDLEKGAWRFYDYIIKHFPDEPVRSVMEKLSKAEIAHAKTVYGFWNKLSSDSRSFDELYDGLDGDILEGGLPLESVVSTIESGDGNRCVNIIELAIHIEYSAFDLYRVMADRIEDRKAQDAFMTIAQGEKSHMKALAGAVQLCV